MGTRGLLGFRKGGKDKLTYNHLDSYPSGIGVRILERLKKHTFEEMNEAFDRIKMVDEDAATTPEIVKELGQWTDLGVSGQSTPDWYCLLRKAQGHIHPYISGGLVYMIDCNEFIKDSLFCEWGYIVNLDTKMLEVWKGFQSKPDKTNRYGKSYDKERAESIKARYYPCKMIKEYPLDNLPDAKDFIKELEGEDEEAANSK